MPTELTISSLENVILYPLQSGSNQSSIFYELNPSAGQPFDHLRFRRGSIVNSSVYHPRVSGGPDRRVTGTSLYGGVLFNAFGHFIAESLHRLWPVLEDPSLANVPILFHSAVPGAEDEKSLPAWMVEIFGMLGIGMDRLHIIADAVQAERLLVPEQASLLGKGPLHPSYTALFPPARADAKIMRPRRGHVYVSRSKYLHKGSYLGEMLVEQVLAESGHFRILHPQDHSVREVTDILESSESAVFAEGSAIHVLELCRERLPKAFVILRRQRSAFKEYFSGMMDIKAEQVKVSEARAFLTSLGWSQRRQTPLGQNASSVQDLSVLLKGISEFCGVALRMPAEAEMRQAHALSLANLILDPRATIGMQKAEGPEALLSLLQDQVLQLDILPFDIPQRVRKASRDQRDGRDDDLPPDPASERQARRAERMQQKPGRLRNRPLA